MSGVAATALLFSVPALAQSSANTGAQIQLETISVQGEAPDENGESAAAGTETATGPVKGYVASKSTTGSKSDTAITAIPQSVSVIGREEIDDRNPSKLDEVLRYTAGVSTAPFGGPDADTDWFYIRGFQATQTGVYLDGMQLFAYGFGGFQIDPFFLERVEVLKGPASVLYGGSNPGGIVNLVSKRPESEPFGYVETGINNWGTAYLGLDFGGVSGEQGEWSYRFTGRIAGGDQHTDYSEQFRGTLMPQITYQPTDTTSLTVYGQYSTLDQVHTGGVFLPYIGSVVDAPYGKISRETFLGEPDIDDQDRWQALVGYELNHMLESGWEIDHSARYGHVENSEAGPYTFGYVDPTFVTSDDLYRIAFEHDTAVDTFTTDTRVSGDLQTGSFEHEVLVGIDYKYFMIDHTQISGIGGAIDPVNPVYGTPQVYPWPPYIDQEVAQHIVGFYAQDQIRFGGGWLVTLNGRYDYVDTEATGLPAYESNDEALSGRVGLAYEFANGLTPYVSAATFFNPLIGLTATNTPQVPEEGQQFEAGVKYEPTFLDALITASVFDLTKQNALIVDTFNPIQRGEMRSRGFELEAKANVTENLKVIAAFTALDVEVTEDTDPTVIGKTPTTVPDIMAALWVDYEIGHGAFEGVSFGAGVRYQGESWADPQNTLKVPDALLFDAAVRYERDDWGVALNVNNIFDEKYVKGCGSPFQCGYGDSRTITLSAHYKW